MEYYHKASPTKPNSKPRLQQKSQIFWDMDIIHKDFLESGTIISQGATCSCENFENMIK